MSCGLPSPRTSEDFTLDTVTRADIPFWYHVYNTAKHPAKADSFNRGSGNTRFAPIAQTDGSPVPTYYVANHIEAVLMESLLHDVERSPPGLFEVESLDSHFLVTLELPEPLRFVSFHSGFLPKLRLTRAQLIDCEPACYPETRSWSQAAFDQRPAAQAVACTSRLHEVGRSTMLFGQCMPRPPFKVLADENLGRNPRLRARVLKLVRSLNLHEF